jgi:TRAP-type C4-dicarboxylate transport system permease small subunit
MTTATTETTLQRIDRAWAKGEGRLLVAVLILMILVAGFQAAVRNLTRFDVAWANALLTDLDWADSLLRKGTLWLSFLGASLATYNLKHINMDILLRVAPPKPKYTMLAIASFIGALITFGMTYSFSSAVYLNLTERPVEYEMLSESGESQHVCEGTDAQIAKLDGLVKPTTFCFMRAALGAVGIPAETPGAAFQLIVPIMLFVMSVRMFGQGIMYVQTVMGGEEALAKAEQEEHDRMMLQQSSLHAEAEDNK